jgi:hypothetical protein
LPPNKKKIWLLCVPNIDTLYCYSLNYKQDWQGGLRLLNIAAFGVAMETHPDVLLSLSHKIFHPTFTSWDTTGAEFNLAPEKIDFTANLYHYEQNKCT